MQHQRRKILFLPSWFPNKKHPENGDFILRHAKAAATLHDIYVVFLSSDPSQKTFIQTETESHSGLEIYRVFYKASSNRFIQFLQYIYVYMLSVHRLAARIGVPDLCHVHVIYPAGLVAVLFKWLFGIRFLLTEHWTGHLESNSQHDSTSRRLLSGFIARQAEIIAPVSRNLAEALRRKGMGREFRLIYNVVDTNAFEPAVTKESALSLIHVSSLKDEQKNISGILRVMRRIQDAAPYIRLDIVGDGDASPHVQLAKELELQNVSFHSKMRHKELSEFMASHHAFLLFSNSENLPCVMVEAMACGLPLIATNVGGISEHLLPEHGILIDARDEYALYESILELNKRILGFNKDKIRRYAEENFSVTAVAKQFDDLYREILSGKSHAS